MKFLNNKITKRIINIILNIFITLFFIILLINIYTNIQLTLLKNSYASFFGYSIFEVQTGSMEPAISAGDCVIVKYSKEFDLDDIITFDQNGEFITHRIIEAYKGTFVTQGDANNAKDDPISKEQIVGKVIKILPGIGILRTTLMNPAVLIALIITFYLVSLIFKDRKQKEQIKEVKEMTLPMKLIEKFKEIFKRPKKELPNNIQPERTVIEERIEKIETHVQNFETDTLEIPTENFSEEQVINEIEEEKYEDEDLDKTMYFRMISVDDEPIIQEVIDQEIKSEKQETKKTEQKKSEPKTEKKETKTKTNEMTEESIVKELENIQKKRKKFKNIIEKAMFIKEEELHKIVDLLLQDNKNKSNITTIKTTLIKNYIDAKYYNYCGNINVEYNKKNMNARLTLAINAAKDDLIKSYKGSDKKYEEKVDKVAKAINLTMHLEQAFLIKEGIRLKRDNYKSRILKSMSKDFFEGPILNTLVNEIIEIQKLHSSMVKVATEKLDTNTFQLIKNPVAKNIEAVYLDHNVVFSKVYSDYIVDKTYQEGVIAEDKIAVLITLLSREILTDMYNQNFYQRYLVYIPESLYAKSNKLSAMFDKFEDEYAKMCTVILIQYDELSKNTKVIRALIKEGYKFAVDLSKIEKIKTKDLGVLELMNNIFIDRKTKEKKEIIKVLSDKAQARVIYDNIEEKIGSFWG